MHRLFPLTLFLILPAFLLGGCASSQPVFPESVEIAADLTTPMTEVTFLVAPPVNTPGGSRLALLLLDTIAGLEIQTVQTPLSSRSDGRFEATLTVPVGSTLTYRYIRTGPSEAVEVTAYFEPVQFRVAHVPGPTQIEETIAGWSDSPHQGVSGRIIGRILNLQTGKGERELLVSAGGVTTFTEADGGFRIDGLPEGLQQLTVVSPDGAFLPASQGALVAAGTTTPAVLRVRPARPVFVTFQLTVPEALNPEVVVRLAGNITTLGNRFSALDGGMRVSVEHLPVLVQVDPQHYLAVLSLYGGTDLRYKYTLGDGLWNAERNEEGALVTRQIVLPDQDLVLRDEVYSWGSPQTPPVRFAVQIPENTPKDDFIGLQINPYQWFEPIPMWPLGERTWYFDLYGPLEKDVELQYRYCRNLQCGIADDADTAGEEASGRTLTYQGDPIALEDDVRAWRWLEDPPPAATVTAVVPNSRPEMLLGIELSPNYEPSWRFHFNASPYRVQSLGSNAYILPLTWTWVQQNPFPILNLDPAHSPFTHELKDLQLAAKNADLVTILKTGFHSQGSTAEEWWLNAGRDPTWWQIWFEEYQQYAITAADTAAELGVDVLILGGRYTTPALPNGVLPNGDASGVPADAEDRWRAVIESIRSRYTGRLVFELAIDVELPDLPAFLDSVDVIGFDWQAPLLSDTPGDVGQMAERIAPVLDLLETQVQRFNRPIWLNLEYASVQGGATACPPAPDGSCRSISNFELGQDMDPDLASVPLEQAEAINAVLLAVHDRSSIQGVFVRGYYPIVLLWDKSSSIYGKSAEDVLRYWYPRLQSGS